MDIIQVNSIKLLAGKPKLGKQAGYTKYLSLPILPSVVSFLVASP